MRTMNKDQLGAVVEAIGLPSAYYQFPEKTGQEPPFVCFYIQSSDDFTADNRNMVKIRNLVLELYTDNKDYTWEAAVEAALDSAGLTYSTAESYIDSERMYMVAYNAQFIFTEE